jgi:hypothetical protein
MTAMATAFEKDQWRHLIENCFQRLKEFRHIATCYHKADASFTGAIHLVAAFLALKWMSTNPSWELRPTARYVHASS